MLDPLTLDQLRVLVAVADAGSFSAAARKLLRVQSAISQSVQALEATLGLALFDRTGKTPKPTEAGRVVVADARRLIGEAAMLRARAGDIGRGLEPELKFALGPVLPNQVVIEALRDLSREFPHLPVSLLTEPLGAPERHLRSGAAQIAIYSLEDADAGLEGEFLTNIAFVPVVAADHPLAAEAGPLSRGTLEPHVQLVLTDSSDRGTWTFAVVAERVWRFADLHTRFEFLLAGLGWCNMPLHMVASHVAAGRLKRLTMREQTGYVIPMYAVHRRDHPPGIAGRWLIDRLRRGLAEADARAGTDPGAVAVASPLRDRHAATG